ncbi:5-oxoprolinase/urea amidolyase family protein [Brevibacterium samyangense]|uniref:5-oxoprolinase/urea amidolyase family protein n=1 Tax=Brevibacterium samyangense TaxID=366888 RepID=A0ABP5ESP9_9MICO
MNGTGSARAGGAGAVNGAGGARAGGRGGAQPAHALTRILPAGEHALLLEYPDLHGQLAHFAGLSAALADGRLPGVRELVPAARTVLVRFDPVFLAAADLGACGRSGEPWAPGSTSPADGTPGNPARALAAALAAVPAADHEATDRAPLTLDVVYDGEDLAAAAEALGLSPEELVRRHTSATWTGAFGGFAPGFVYCASEDWSLDVPRRSSPRTRVPAGSVAIAGEFSAVYPRESPGGWQLLGHTATPMWDLDRTPPALLQPGQEIRYRAVRDRVEAISLPVEDPSAGASDGPSNGFDEDDRNGCRSADRQQIRSSSSKPLHSSEYPSLLVVRSGPQLTVQDLGRPGLLGMGVGASGAADREAARVANRLVGNPETAGVLELAAGGAEFEVQVRGVAAWTGASGTRVLRTADGEERPFPYSAPFAVDPGDRLRIAGFSAGQRGYLAVRGGIGVSPVLGSRSTDTLSGLGPALLRAGDRIPLGDAQDAGPVDPGTGDAGSPRDLPAVGRLGEVRFVLGPRADWFTPAALATLAAQEWTVTPQSDRVGARLDGAVPLARAITDELPSEGAVRGALQVPADGRPVLFLADHPVTGGYPIIAAVVGADLDLAAQLPPGARVRFRIVPGPLDTSPTPDPKDS